MKNFIKTIFYIIRKIIKFLFTFPINCIMLEKGNSGNFEREIKDFFK